MIKNIILISVSVSLLAIPSVFAELSQDALIGADAPMTQSAYNQLVKEKCEGSDKAWNTDQVPPLKSIPAYAKLNTEAINATIQDTIALSTTLPSDQQALAERLEKVRQGNITTLKTVALATEQYHTAMNGVFACAVIHTRINVIQNLRGLVNKQFPTKKDDIITRLENEAKRYNVLWNSIGCQSAEETKTPVTTLITNTATKQYCYFDTYLSFLEDNYNKNNFPFLQMEQQIGAGGGTKLPTTTSELLARSLVNNNQIGLERERAKSNLLRAARTIQEMNRTYGLHIMLVYLYDDYLHLRENLNRYLNASSQLFEKTFNAQSPNKAGS